ncbi:hypothetical protein Psi02_31240 [Planotetraspora silvatica]|uniref:Uncharacterized protein n=1 Tax=Planotetraspora silvatica TaxID=234614 RepID=A0A8J3XMY6_9ACTN|nr:hypothetical protein Psi02_31240 [Planotetraspora silvatica]
MPGLGCGGAVADGRQNGGTHDGGGTREQVAAAELKIRHVSDYDRASRRPEEQ